MKFRMKLGYESCLKNVSLQELLITSVLKEVHISQNKNPTFIGKRATILDRGKKES